MIHAIKTSLVTGVCGSCGMEQAAISLQSRAKPSDKEPVYVCWHDSCRINATHIKDI